MIGLGLGLARGGLKAASSFDPASLSFTGWWRASFSGSPWSGTASAGSSGSRSLTEASSPPTTGAALNGLTPADFDGSNDRLETGIAVSSFLTASAGSVFCLFRADTAASNAPGTPYTLPALTTDAAPTFGMSYATGGVVAWVHDGAYKEVQVAASTLNWHLAQMKWNSSNVLLRIDSGSWSSVAAGNLSNTALNVTIGRNYAAAAFFDGRVAELGFAASALSDGTFDNIKAYINARYALSL